MVDLTLEQPGDHLFIRSVTDRQIQVVDQWYSQALVVGERRLVVDWALHSIQDFGLEHLDPIFDFEPEIVIIGTGRRQHFLPAELMMAFYERGIGAEVMTTPAACRTFNVLISEGRRVVAALLPPGH